MITPEPSQGILRDRVSHQRSEPFPGERVARHVGGMQTAGKFSCAEAVLVPGAGQPMHVHHNIDELLYVLDGQIDFALEGRRFQTGAGGFVFVPKGMRHTFRNLGAEPARLLGVFSPSAMDGFFEAMEGQPASAFQEIAHRYGIEIVGPMLEPA